MLLKNKNAIVYGAAGAIGSAVAHAFAREGARVFLTGRTLSKLQVVGNEIIRAGGLAEIARVDAFKPGEVEEHAREVVHRWDSIDISLNVVSLDDLHGVPLVEMTQHDFALPVMNAMATQFYTTTVAAKQMTAQRSGVILALTAQAGIKPHPNVGGWGVTCASIEALCRQLAVELGPKNIRVVCLRSAGSPDAPGVDQVFHEHATKLGVTRQAFEATIAESTMLKRLPRVTEIANAAVLMASDHASAITGAMTNLTCGEVAD